MNDPSALIADYYELNPTQYTVLVSLELKQGISSAGVCEQELHIALSKSTNGESGKLRLTFSGVRNLEFRQPDWSEISIGHLEILLASVLANPDGKYLVRDPEQERIIWFECDNFDARVG